MKHSCTGYSLIELLVAMSIFSIASLATARLMLGATMLVSENELASEAVVIAQTEIEKVRALPFDDMNTDTNHDPIPSSRGGVYFSLARTVTDDEADGIKRIAVTVSWNDHGRTKTYETHSIFTQVAPNL